MTAQRMGNGRANALRGGERTVTVEQDCAVPAEVVWDVLANLRTHAQWGGERQKRNTRILSIDAPEGVAGVGTEFATTGADPMGRFGDRSVVTEATRPSTFEFVTEAGLETKKGKRSDWTVVHRYELTPKGTGCRIAYTIRLTRISDLVGMLAIFNVPGLSTLALKGSAGVARRGVKNLAAVAEERATAR
jgi:uncharacterized protein YndB with AHSA1/START domain